MKKAHSARRVPRKIGSDDDEGDVNAAKASGSTPISAIRRPATKPRKSTPLRSTFGGSDVDNGDNSDGDDGASLIAPKKSGLSRVAMQRNTLKPRSSQLVLDATASRRAEDHEDKPSYSVAALKELRDSTPSTPRSVSNTEIDRVSSGTRELDLSSKFGTSLSRYQQPSAIPSAAEIAEKKARRARLAKEHAAEEFISLDPDDPGLDDDGEELDPNVERDERGRLVLKAKPDKYSQAETRLVRDDEDLMEGFEEFTEADSKMALGRNAEAEAARKRRSDIAAQIAEAEGRIGSGGDDDLVNDDDDAASDDSERERNAIFEASQTRHGMYASSHQHGAQPRDEPNRPRTPPRIAPLPTLDGALTRLRSRLTDMQSERARHAAEMEALRREKVRLADEEVRIQRALKETAEKFAALRADLGGKVNGGDSDVQGVERDAQSLTSLGVSNGVGSVPNDDAVMSS